MSFPRIAILISLLGPVCMAQALTPQEEIAKAAEVLRPELIATRRDFHRHPELSNREVRTSLIVADRLRELGLEDITTNVAGHGVIAVLKGGKPGTVVAMRAEMDALPINETLDVPYKSQTPGVKHACGHDAHTTMELGVAEILSRMRAEIPGTVKFIFEPAEESPPPGQESSSGLMIKEGALENPRPAAIFAMHCTPEIEAGLIGIRSGAAQAVADRFVLVVRGKPVPVLHPEQGVDAILAAAQCVSALQSIKSLRLNNFDPFMLSIRNIQGENNPMAKRDEVALRGSIRALSEATRKRVKELMRQTVEGICAAYGATYDLSFSEIAPLMFNDPKLVSEAAPWLREAIGASNVIEAPLRMGVDDFACFEQAVPGVYFRLGSGNKARGIVAEIHTPEFDIDENCLVTGTKVMATVLFNYLQANAPSQ